MLNHFSFSFGHVFLHFWAEHHHKSFLKLWGSDADVAFHFSTYGKSYTVYQTEYGRFYMHIIFGKFMLEYTSKYGWKWCNYFATGCGG